MENSDSPPNETPQIMKKVCFPSIENLQIPKFKHNYGNAIFPLNLNSISSCNSLFFGGGGGHWGHFLLLTDHIWGCCTLESGGEFPPSDPSYCQALGGALSLPMLLVLSQCFQYPSQYLWQNTGGRCVVSNDGGMHHQRSLRGPGGS